MLSTSNGASATAAKRLIISLPVSLPDPPFSGGYTDIAFVFSLSALLALREDDTALLADLRAEYETERLAAIAANDAFVAEWQGKEADEGFSAAQADSIARLSAWEAFKRDWKRRRNFKLLGYTIEWVGPVKGREWPLPTPPPSPAWPESFLSLEPAELLAQGHTICIDWLLSPAFLEEVLARQTAGRFP